MSHAAKRAVRPQAVLIALGGILFLALGVSVAWGAVPLPLSELGRLAGRWLGWTDPGSIRPSHALILEQIRLPRALAALWVGWTLAVSGTVMQGLFRNALASPYLLGIASGASAGAAAAIVLGQGGGLGLPLSAFGGGTLAVALVYGLARARPGEDSSYTLILSGVALGALFSAATSFLIFISGEQLREIVFWTMGGLGRAHWGALAWLAPVTLGGTAALWPFMAELNALALGERGARHLGVRAEVLKGGLLGLTTLMTASAVAVSGTIGFVGLITPHALRLVVGPDHRVLLPASALAGASFLMLADTAARTAWVPLELPVGVLTALLGAPFFLYLLFTRRGGAR